MTHQGQDHGAQDARIPGPSFIALLRHMADESVQLVRSEATVIRLEMEESTRAIILDAIKTTLYSAVALLGLLSLLAFLIIGLAALITGQLNSTTAFWTSALVIGVVFTTVGGFMAWRHARHIGTVPGRPASPDRGPKRTQTGARRPPEDGGFHAQP
ncbi:MAG: phage holin family protein [Gammaproteobacteria bacterium]|nr:phage holin family protein [Gammaproteobacteria bacterium]